MKLLSLILLLCISQLTYSQVRLSSNDWQDISSLKDHIVKSGGITEGLLRKYPLQLIGGTPYLSFIGKTDSTFSKDNNLFIENGILVHSKIGEIASIKIPVNFLTNEIRIPGFLAIQLASKIGNQLDKAVQDTRADSVHQGIGLPASYSGKDVYIGITDWGFDYSSPMFYDTSLQQTRIVAAWDQYKLSGPSPIPFGYGTEYDSAAELLSAGSDTANIYSYSTHGTHVAGIAGGSGAGTQYKGIAYDANFLFCTFLVDEAAVLDAWQWMYNKAQADGKRLVINMSWGLYHIGTLDGSSMLSQAISAYADSGVVFANSGGNNGNVNFHLKKIFTPQDTIVKSKIDFYSYNSNPNMWGQSIHAWGEVGKSFSTGFSVLNSAGATLAQSPQYNTATTINAVDSFVIAGFDTIFYKISADASHPLNGKPQIRMRVKNTNTSLRVIMKSIATSGTVHYWNVTELSNDVGNWGMPFSTSGSGTVPGNNENGISEPSCSDDVISVAAYATQYPTQSGNLVGGAIASFSSVGPRYDGVMKPDIAAPGVSIISSISSYTDVAVTSLANVNFNGRTYHFGKFSGTSMASPMVAGIAALILDANPYLSSQQVKEIIMQTAREDNYTGNIPDSGSVKWGAGKVNAYAAVKLALQTIGFEHTPTELEWNVYPNPVINELHFTIVEDLPEIAEIIDIEGNVYEKSIQDGKLRVSDLAPGTYFIRLIVKERVQQERFIKI
jgi:minor extracellular serine protease Vpr